MLVAAAGIVRRAWAGGTPDTPHPARPAPGARLSSVLAKTAGGLAAAVVLFNPARADDPAATVVRLTCTSEGAPAQSAPSTVQALSELPGDQAIVKLTLDDQGWATKVESDPVCG